MRAFAASCELPADRPSYPSTATRRHAQQRATRAARQKTSSSRRCVEQKLGGTPATVFEETGAIEDSTKEECSTCPLQTWCCSVVSRTITTNQKPRSRLRLQRPQQSRIKNQEPRTMTEAPASIDVSSGTKLYKLLLAHIGKSCTSGTLEANVVPARGKSGKSSSCSDDDCLGCPSSSTAGPAKRISVTAGFGEFSFADFHGIPMTANHQYLGAPVGTQCDAVLYRTLMVSCPTGRDHLLRFFGEVVEKSETSKEGYIQIFHWHNRYRYWNETTRIKARPLTSVILPDKTISTILNDFDGFVAQETQDFYEKHGIPYRRSYLFYGVPGAGKTSFIQALAGKYERSVAYLNVDPEMTDDALRGAMDSLPEDTIVVLEDIDALFTKGRVAKQAKSTLTFSGLLNALDGVGSSLGQLFILTTNLREELDAALIRNGRVDLQVFFDHANDEQVVKMWRAFYPTEASADGEDDDLAVQFCRSLRAKLDGKPIACCALQHFFVTQRTHSAATALTQVDALIEDMLQKEVDAAAEKEKEKAKKEGKEDDDEDKDEKDAGDGDKEKKTESAVATAPVLPVIHIHIHGVDASSSASTGGLRITATTAPVEEEKEVAAVADDKMATKVDANEAESAASTAETKAA